MKKLVLIAMGVFTAEILPAQELNAPFENNYSDKKSSLSLNADYFFNSNAITTAFVDGFYRGQFLNSSLINKTSGNLSSENQLGAELNASIRYRYQADSSSKFSGYGFFFSIQERNHADAQFTNDLFNLVFYGNEPFAGKTANLSNFNVNAIQYQQFQAGLSGKLKKCGINYGLGLSALNGQNYQNIVSKNSSIYTSPDGQYLDFTSNTTYRQSNQGNNNTGNSNGTGFSADAYIQKSFKINANWTEKMTFELRDIGMIWWNSNSRTATIDSVYHYDGVTINNIFNVNSSAFGKANSDSLFNRLVRFKSAAFNSVLPGVIHFNTTSVFGKWQLSKGIRYMYDANYKLNVYLTANYYLSKKFMVSLGASYGGYSLLNFNAGIGLDIGKGYIVHVFSNSIEGFIIPQTALGQGLSLSLTKKF